ncbi:MAG: hypothetical protein MI919_01755, partial [Holophagales bacterium]|nr:hypothetical protein [Holophagales bacterium]
MSLPPSDALETAQRIARRICGSALWQGDRCSWEVRVEGEGRVSRSVAAGGALYQGTAGIAFFLAQLHAATGEPGLERVARGALEHALGEGGGMPSDAWGFHSGRVGVAWVAAVAAELLGDDSLAPRAAELLRPLVGHEGRDQALDVIAGAAGAVPALLELADRLPPEALGTLEPRAMAVGLGQHLLGAAHRGPEGWSWPTLPDSAVRNLAGLAHGAAGIGLALLELA